MPVSWIQTLYLSRQANRDEHSESIESSLSPSAKLWPQHSQEGLWRNRIDSIYSRTHQREHWHASSNGLTQETIQLWSALLNLERQAPRKPSPLSRKKTLWPRQGRTLPLKATHYWHMSISISFAASIQFQIFSTWPSARWRRVSWIWRSLMILTRRLQLFLRCVYHLAIFQRIPNAWSSFGLDCSVCRVFHW